MTFNFNTQPELSQVLQSIETKIDENDNSKNNITTCYFYGNGLNAQDNGKDYFVYHYNNVGSTMAVTDGKGNVVEQYNYTPYGELIKGEYRDDIPFLYNGQYGVVTDNNGLYYMRARYYNVEIKRFINQDVLLGVLERVSSLNRYAYVEGNPVSYLDPFGLEVWESVELHEIATCLQIIGIALLFICPMAGLIVSTIVNGFDAGLSAYDAVVHYKRGAKDAFVMDIVSFVWDIVSIAFAGGSYLKTYIKEGFDFAIAADGLSSGYEHQITMLYDKTKGLIDASDACTLFSNFKGYIEGIIRVNLFKENSGRGDDDALVV